MRGAPSRWRQVHPHRRVCVYVLGGGRAFLKRAPAGARLPLRPRWPLGGVCVQGCRRRVDTRCLGPPHTFSSVQFPPPYVRHFYSTPSSHHLNLSQRASGARRAVNTKSAAAKTRFLMSGGGGSGLPFQPLSRRSESVGVCVRCFEIFIRAEAAHYDLNTYGVRSTAAFPMDENFANLENSALLLAQRTAERSV
jgi:hypothetical protein